jgi:hypothetical protein
MTEVQHRLQDEEEELTTADMAAARSRDAAVREAPRETLPSEADHPGAVAANKVREAPSAPLFPEHDAQALRTHWNDIQTGFVDNPRQAVERADHLVAQTIKRLAEGFADERNRLEQQWSRGDNVSTEDLRIALQRYRSFFDRLLTE